MRSSHAIAFHYSLVIMVAFEVLNESLSIRHLVAHYRKDEFLPTCSCPYLSLLCHPGGVASFRGVASFHDVLNMYPQNVTVRLKFSVQYIYIYMQIVEPLQSLQARPTWLLWILCPFSPEMTMMSLITIATPTSILNNIINILSMETEASKACCWGE